MKSPRLMTTRTGELGDQQRAFFQQRVALFAKVMIGTQALGLAGLLILNPWEQLGQPWFVLYHVPTGLAVGAWLLCRGGVRSVRFVSRVEATLLLGMAAVHATISRLLLPGFMPQYLGSVVSPSDAAGYGRFVGVVQGSIFLEFVIGLSLWVFVRAALVPSRPLRTLVLTALVAGPLLAVTVMRTFPFEPEPSLRSVIPDDLVVTNVINTVVWWTFITGVCTIVSAVIFGLRRQVREARRLGQYTLEEKLGEGGMGAVYRASHAMMRRPTAIKLVRPDQAGETNLARFEREVQLTARLTHPNTVTIFDYGRTPDGVFYYAMELLDGATLDDVVRLDGAQPPGRVLKVLAEVASALEEAHDIDFIHRDIKPANIILCSQGGKPDVAKLVDFGLVKDLAGADGVELTSTEAITGTPLYLSPEALAAPEKVDARSDIYALGAVGYFLLTGEHVFSGRTLVEVCGHHLHTEPEAPSQRLGQPVAEDIEAVLLSCLGKKASHRPQSARELLERIHACASWGEWSEARAGAWWRENGQRLRELHREQVGSAHSMSVVVDLDRREPRSRQTPSSSSPPASR